MIQLNEQLKSDNFYIQPVISWLNDEWKNVKKLLFRNIIDLSKSFSEVIIFDSNRTSEILTLLKSITDITKKELRDRVNRQKQLVKRDASTRIGTNNTGIIIDSESVERIIQSLDLQMQFVDDVTKNLSDRLTNLTKARYGDISDLTFQLDNILRISRDEILGSFESEVDKLANSLRNKRISSEVFQTKMMNSIEKNYRRAFRAGKGIPLTDEDIEFIKRQVESQFDFLDNFTTDIETKIGANQELTSAINRRAKLYATRTTALYEAGWVTNLDDDTLIDWVLGIAEHCNTCPIYATNSPYLKSTLPGLPGEGFNITECGTNCKCHLEINQLSIDVLDSQESELQTLGIDFELISPTLV